MFKNKLLLLVFFICFQGFSQVKKATDTIYIYEEVIVYDTIYIEKPIERMRFEKIIISPIKKGVKPFLTIIENNKKIIIPVDSLIFERKRKPFKNNWRFAAKLTTGIQSNSLFDAYGAKVQMSYGVGVFVKKTLFHKHFSVGLGIEVGFLNSNLIATDSTSTSFLSGYYFTNQGNPKLFEELNNKGFQIQIPLQFYWKINKFTPSAGVLVNSTNYEATFRGSSGNVPATLDENQKFGAQSYYFGYLFQLDYAFHKNWSTGLNYRFANSKNVNFKRNQESFAIDKTTKQSAFEVYLMYCF
jgi:hypothetical protein